MANYKAIAMVEAWQGRTAGRCASSNTLPVERRAIGRRRDVNGLKKEVDAKA